MDLHVCNIKPNVMKSPIEFICDMEKKVITKQYQTFNHNFIVDLSPIKSTTPPRRPDQVNN